MSAEDEIHFRVLFDYAPISLWEQDYSEIKRFFDGLRAQGVSDLDRYLTENPGELEASMARIKVVSLNQRTLEMFGAKSKDELLAHLGDAFRDEMRIHFRDELLTLWRGGLTWVGEGINYTLQGEPLHIRLHWRILPGHEQTWDCVMVSLEDITALKRAEAALSVSEVRFRNLFDHAPISLWEEDYAGLKGYLDELRGQGVTDLQVHLAQHPEVVDRCMDLIRVLDVNQKTLTLFQAENRDALLANLKLVFRDEMRAHFAGELIDMWDGKNAYEREGINYSLAGEPLHVHIDWRLMPGHEQDFGWVLVAIQDITARKQAEEYLRYLGTHDVLTGLFNRAYLEEQMKKLEAGGFNESISLLLLDLDGLKAVNDQFGHLAGDNIIRRAAEVLRAAFGETDIAARIGGDEFAVLLPNTSIEDAQQAIERVRTLIPLNNTYYQGSELSLSIGASTHEAGETLEKTLSRADKAMYADKAARRKNLRK
jgi:diguanylate cyclase (GGDEF)-like protein